MDTENDLRTEIDEPTPVGFSEPGPFSDISIVDAIRQEAQELADIKDVFIPVKGYEKTGLRVRYRMPESGKELDAIARKVMSTTKDTFTRNLLISMDTMAHLCIGLYVLPPDIESGNDEPIEFDPELTGAPITFDMTLANILGMSTENVRVRQIIKKLFGNNDMAVLNHAEKLNRWLNDSKADLTTEFWQMGEI